MTIANFLPQPGEEADSLISTTKGAQEGQTLLYTGIRDLKREIRHHAYGLIDEDPLAERTFYYPVEGRLQEVRLHRADEVVGSEGTTVVFEVGTVVPGQRGERLFTFDIFITND